jgi:hypothetical protein
METRIRTSFKRASDSELLSFVHKVLGKMEGNVHFPHLPPAFEQLQNELPGFIAALTHASGGDQEKAAIKRAKKAVIVGLVMELGDYVTATCQGNKAMLLSSGFALRRDKHDTGLGDIREFKITADVPGEAITRVKRVAGARAYIHQYTPEPLTTESVWVNKVVTDPVATFNGLLSKERYLFRVVAVGVKGQEVMSQVVARVIQ